MRYVYALYVKWLKSIKVTSSKWQQRARCGQRCERVVIRASTKQLNYKPKRLIHKKSILSVVSPSKDIKIRYNDRGLSIFYPIGIGNLWLCRCRRPSDWTRWNLREWDRKRRISWSNSWGRNKVRTDLPRRELGRVDKRSSTPSRQRDDWRIMSRNNTI